ncbi:MerR family transcriptional regulator [Actinomadura xylanilytica]|uniref:MerR family transcriptional regulator n=1 Tax=Actinomadura xylanilytica TaxID=887459 RepID=UPI00255B30F8|nr:MerR family transcriptional regulator [Actinomadura xylanilytica]MDL4773856.1 MerR family transcriptional regulator [Actinomadura xylanilytica]
MTKDTDGTLFGIGDLARSTGVPVRTIRFYCDEGILESRRSEGGHRRFDASAVDRLNLVRSLRNLGMGLPAIAHVLTGERSVAEAVAAERAALDVELAALAWRHASLRAIEEAAPSERAARLDLLSAAGGGRAAREALVAFWRRVILSPLRPEVFDTFVAMNVPDPPADPTTRQVVAYAEMVALVGDRSLTRRLQARSWANRKQIPDENALVIGIGTAAELALPLMGTGRAPDLALDCFVTTHASARGRRDTPAFRRELLANSALDRDPAVQRYWTLTTEITHGPVSPGSILAWLLDALERSLT